MLQVIKIKILAYDRKNSKVQRPFASSLIIFSGLSEIFWISLEAIKKIVGENFETAGIKNMVKL